MCGIAGFIDFNNKSDQQCLENMTDVLHHRGPDDSGYQLFQSQVAQIGLGHRRLSILDLSKSGHQPMKHQSLHIVYNGEVYNFKEIAHDLQQLGYSFDSHSDTEVILKAFDAWGIKAVDHFNGMFAFTIYDEKSEKIYIFRDRSGIKPLFWYKKDDLILFASELKSFHQHPDFQKTLNKNSIALFLQHQYIPEPHTIFEYTHKLKAGHFMEISLHTKEIKIEKYWDVINAYNSEKLDISEDDALNKLDSLLKSAFSYRMVADVPVGVFLSGGYDSSLVTAILQNGMSQKLKTFTIGFHERGYDETPHARAVAKHLGTEHTEYFCTQKDALDIIPTLPQMFDEPFADSSAIPTTLVSKLAKEKVSVSLSADGGDEIFAGYETYTTVLSWYAKMQKLSPSLRKLGHNFMGAINPEHIPYLKNTYNFATRYEKIKNLLLCEDSVEAMKLTMSYFTPDEIEKALAYTYQKQKTNFDTKSQLNSNNDNIDQMLAIDYKTYMLDDILTKVDRTTMSVSLEGREPLLDYRIIEFAAKLPSHLKYKDGTKKYLLKQLTHQYIPKEIMDRPKMGFGVPLMEWFKDELKTYFLHYLDFDRLEKQNIFNPHYIVNMRDRYLDGKQENIEKLWSILVFQMWHEKWMEKV